MAIQTRRGDYVDYDASKMLPAEFATVLQNDPRALDGKALHIAYAPGVDKTLMTFEDAEAMIEDAAEEAASEATAAATQIATQAATTATNQAKLSESYAKGGTGTRSGENTDNSKYYKEQAASSASTATTKASEASSSASTATTKATAAANSAAEAAASAAQIGDYALWFKEQAVTATTGDILTISNAKITANHIVAECVWGDPSAITSDVTWTTSAGSLVLNGTCETATTATILLVYKTN